MTITNEEVLRRVEKIEEHIDEMKDSYMDMRDTLSKLNTTLVLLNQTVTGIQKREEDRRVITTRIILFFIGSFVAAIVAFLVNGGLS